MNVWLPGNRIRLLENGEAYYPRVFEVIRAAQREVLIETFILFDDKVGRALRDELIAAARRGVTVHLTVDGYGSPDLSEEFVGGMTAAGVHFHVFDPQPKLLGLRTNLFRRMHRKIVVVDATLAFVGGINFSLDHLQEYGPEAKQDYAIEIEGPVVADIHGFAAQVVGGTREQHRRWWHGPGHRHLAPAPLDTQDAVALFVVRDNQGHRTDIEEHYIGALRRAKGRALIANAYFFPGYRLLRELRNAARRGVDVRLVLQGQPDMRWVQFFGRMLYDYLLREGVRIYEYCERPLHGKVAVIDDEWATVGSSNLDPLSLAVNLEANVVVRDRAFAQRLYERLDELVRTHCRLITSEEVSSRNPLRLALSFLAYHFARRFPAWVGLLPAHTPRVEHILPREGDAALGTADHAAETPPKEAHGL